MPRIEHIIVAILIIWALAVIMRRASRTETDQAQPSWAVRTLNAAGADVEAKRLLPAAGELAQRGVVSAVGKTREVVSAKRADRKVKRAEAKTAREERLGEIGEKTRQAIRRGLDLVDAARWRWQERGDRPFVDRRPRGKAEADDDRPVDEDAPDREERRPRRPRWRVLRRFAWRGRPRTRDRDRRSDEDESPDQPEQPEPEPESEQDEKPRRRRRWQRWFRWRRNRPSEQPTVEQDQGEEQPEKPRRSWRLDPDSPEGRIFDLDAVRATAKLSPYQPKPIESQEEHVTATDERRATDPHAGRTIISTPGMGADAGHPSIPLPVDWRAVASRVAEFNPENDADLINFMSSEIGGMCAYSDAYEALFETCTASLGLDPRSVQGLGEFGEQVVELTKQMALAHQRFIVTYAEVMRMVADGTVMPHNGRFFSGDVAV